VVVADAAPADVESWFERPELALMHIPGLRGGRALRDRDGHFAALRARAWRFVWNDAMQAKANRYASREMVGNAEEVHKALAGLRSGNLTNLLDGESGLSWGLNRAVQFQRGVPLALPPGASRGWFEAVEQAVGLESNWARLRRRVFGVGPDADGPGLTLRERVVAGLRLYCATAALLRDALEPDAVPLVEDAVRLIHDALGRE